MTDEYESPYFGKTITDEEIEHLKSLTDKQERRDYLAVIRARALKQFPGIAQRMTGNVNDFLRAVENGKSEKDPADWPGFSPEEAKSSESNIEGLKKLLAYKPERTE